MFSAKENIIRVDNENNLMVEDNCCKTKEMIIEIVEKQDAETLNRIIRRRVRP